MLEWFEHHGHVCILFELLGLRTYDFIKENGFLPFRLDHIRQMAYQICKSVNCKYMHVCWFYLELVYFSSWDLLTYLCICHLAVLHLNKLKHTDLKPENILFVQSDYVEEYNPRLVSCCHLPLLPRSLLGLFRCLHLTVCFTSET